MVDAQRSGRCEAIHEGSNPSPPTQMLRMFGRRLYLENVIEMIYIFMYE